MSGFARIRSSYGYSPRYGSVNGIQKNGFTITSNKETYIDDLYRLSDESDATSFRSSLDTGLPCQIRIIFPKPYSTSGFLLSAMGGSYYRLKQFDIYVKYGNDTTFSEKIYSSENFANATFNISRKFDKIYSNVTGVALQVNSKYGSNTFGFSEFNIYDATGLSLLKFDDSYYSISPENYDSESHSYNPLPTDSSLMDDDFYLNNAFYLDDLFTETTINDETFKPIDKFNNFKIVQQSDINVKVFGYKTKSELLLPTSDIDTSVAEQINYFKSLQNLSGDGDLKIVISKDKGKTWNSYDSETSALIPLDITIPLLSYSNLSEEQKTQWDNAKLIIQTHGISVEIFNSIDFNSLLLDSDKVRFAYVLSIENYEDIAELDELNWSFDAKGIMRKMTNNEFEVYSHVNQIVVTPSVSTEILKTNILV